MASLHRCCCHLKQRTKGGTSCQVGHSPILAAIHIRSFIQLMFVQTPLLAQPYSGDRAVTETALILPSWGSQSSGRQGPVSKQE